MMFDSHAIVDNASVKLKIPINPSDMEIIIDMVKLHPDYKSFVAELIIGETENADVFEETIENSEGDTLSDIGVVTYAINYLLNRKGNLLDLTKVLDLGRYKEKFDDMMKELGIENDTDIPTTKELEEWFTI